jgi:hypothetical protein
LEGRALEGFGREYFKLKEVLLSCRSATNERGGKRDINTYPPKSSCYELCDGGTG